MTIRAPRLRFSELWRSANGEELRGGMDDWRTTERRLHAGGRPKRQAARPFALALICLVLAALLTGCRQDEEPNGQPAPPVEDGETTTVERPPAPPDPVPPGSDTPSTAEADGCRISAHFVLELGSFSRRFRDLEPGFEIDPRAVPMIRVVPILAATGLYPGTLTISVTQAGRDVPFTTENGTAFQTTDPFASTITLGEYEDDELARQVARVEQEIETAGAGYRIRAPAGLGPANPTALETVLATASWRPHNGATCTKSADLDLRWTFGHGNAQPRPSSDRQGKNHLRGAGLTRPWSDANGTAFEIAPIYHYWEVADPYSCCGGRGPYQVIQFARVLYDDEGNNPPFQKGHGWTLDIRESEKQRARNDEPYDPTFTNDPRGTNSGGSMVNPAPGGRSSIRQEDAPGMTRQRYDELVAAAKKVTVTWQFLAFLVCPPDVEANENPAAVYLAEAKVCRVAIYELVWTFPGRVGAPPAVDVRLKEVYRDDRTDLCTQNLAGWLELNGLRSAYDDPPEARSNDLNNDEHRDLKRSFADLRLRLP